MPKQDDGLISASGLAKELGIQTKEVRAQLAEPSNDQPSRPLS